MNHFVKIFNWVCQSFTSDYEQLDNNINKKPEKDSRKPHLLKSNSAAAAAAAPNRKYYAHATVNHLTSISNVPASQPQPQPQPHTSLVKKPNTSCTTTVPVTASTYNDPPYTLKPACVPDNHATSKLLPPPPSIPKLQPKDVSHPKEASVSPPRSSKATLSEFTSSSERSRYVILKENSTYKIPKHMEDLMKNNIVPQVLYKPLSQSTYKDYFATLLYAEDFYIEKWNNFLLKDVTLELEDAEIYKKKQMLRNHEDDKRTRIFVKFEIKYIPQERPFLLSRDFIFAQPLGSRKAKLYEGVIYRVVRSNIVLAEFGDDFHHHHEPTRKYNVSFSFNRVCLKRAHEAIESASGSLFKDFIFPEDFSSRKHFSPSLLFPFVCNFKLDQSQRAAVAAILSLDSAPPYLIDDSGAPYDFRSSRLKSVILESVLQIYQKRNPIYRILIGAPANRSLDELITSLKGKIPESHMFRANATFRQRVDVPEDILSSCRYKEDKDCFICPPLKELLKFQVIFTTFMSSVRLRDKGISSGHFSHIFLLDASLTTEPEALVPLASFANTNTAVVVTGKYGQSSTCVRSDIGRKKGLKMSYFERLRNTLLYNRKDNNGEFVKVV
ncbi:hypothetical protein ACFE04_027661 [Oxalis oulophora]